MITLTQRQQQVLWYVCRYIDIHHRSPALLEIRDHFRRRSTNAAPLVAPLESKGYLIRQPGTARSIQVTANGRRWDFMQCARSYYRWRKEEEARGPGNAVAKMYVWLGAWRANHPEAPQS